MRKILFAEVKRGPFVVALSFIAGLFVVAMATVARFVPQVVDAGPIKYTRHDAKTDQLACEKDKKVTSYDQCATVEKDQNIEYMFVGCNGFF